MHLLTSRGLGDQVTVTSRALHWIISVKLLVTFLLFWFWLIDWFYWCGFLYNFINTSDLSTNPSFSRSQRCSVRDVWVCKVHWIRSRLREQHASRSRRGAGETHCRAQIYCSECRSVENVHEAVYDISQLAQRDKSQEFTGNGEALVSVELRLWFQKDEEHFWSLFRSHGTTL